MGYTPPYLEVRKVTGGYSIYAPSPTSTDDLTIYPNTTDATAAIKLNGNSTLALYTASAVVFYQGATQILDIGYTTPDTQIYPPVNKNLYLAPTGTGRVKFGTYTASAATDSTGYIDIIDAAGNVRKLMVQA